MKDVHRTNAALAAVLGEAGLVRAHPRLAVTGPDGGTRHLSQVEWEMRSELNLILHVKVRAILAQFWRS